MSVVFSGPPSICQLKREHWRVRVRRAMNKTATMEAVEVPTGTIRLNGDLRVPAGAQGLVIFAHGSGSSRFSTRNRQVADFLGERHFATLLLDLLTSQEEAVDVHTAEYRFDIARLGPRVSAAADWAAARSDVGALPIGCFGASTGAAAALIAAAERPAAIAAVVSRGGRPDLAGEALARVKAPTLRIFGGHDEPVIELNREAMRQMHGHVELEIVPGATHLFEEPGTLEQVSNLAAGWFTRYLRGGTPGPGSMQNS
jgi:pimeloyl-ACP methyl ester carboxylesterase